MPDPGRTLTSLNRQVTNCRLCPRLVEHRERVAREKRRAFLDWSYWGKPLPGFGDPQARLVIVGLAPAAHGANRTGRMFTGDRSGDWLYATMHRFGFANQAEAQSLDDGLKLSDAFITAAGRCAPPQNKPTREELTNCLPYLCSELKLLKEMKVVIALGRIAFDSFFRARTVNGDETPNPRPKFGHAAICDLPELRLISSYHPSQQNTQTGRLTQSMFDRVFLLARKHIDQDGE